MEQIGELRQKIYDHFMRSNSCKKYFLAVARRDELASYYTAIYLLQDSTEGLLRHRKIGFNTEPLLAYIEMLGILQAIIIQQDSIEMLYKIFTGKDICKGQFWEKIRNIRILCAGHPVNKGEVRKSADVERSFIARSFVGYNQISIETWNKNKRSVQHRKIKLGNIIDSYTQEAVEHLNQILTVLSAK